MQDLLSVKDTITSPTYVYYNKYNGGVKSEE
ncbi:MAG: hypothetical protein H6767_03460 [Candidatus Peribacteria bacterium]|nr:MAG: hypothetical protein H6767_03460 [Candidatus Peribacteria bacterium]